MFEAQFYNFCVSALFGVAFGVLYELTHLFLRKSSRPYLLFLCDLVFCLLCGGVYFAVMLLFGLPAPKAYMLLGMAFGLFLSMKSLHKAVAFLRRKVYNKIKSGVKQTKDKTVWQKPS